MQCCREMYVLMARQPRFLRTGQGAKKVLPLNSVSDIFSVDTASPFSLLYVTHPSIMGLVSGWYGYRVWWLS